LGVCREGSQRALAETGQRKSWGKARPLVSAVIQLADKIGEREVHVRKGGGGVLGVNSEEEENWPLAWGNSARGVDRQLRWIKKKNGEEPSEES